MLKKAMLIGTLVVTSLAASRAYADCTAYSSCGFRGAKYATCDQYNSCVANEHQKAKEPPPSHTGAGQNKDHKDQAENGNKTKGSGPVEAESGK